MAGDDDQRSDYRGSERHIYDGEEGSGTESEHSGNLSFTLIENFRRLRDIWISSVLSVSEDDFIVTDDGQQPQHRQRRYRFADVPEQAIDDAREIFGVDDFNFAEFYDEDAEVGVLLFFYPVSCHLRTLLIFISTHFDSSQAKMKMNTRKMKSKKNWKEEMYRIPVK